MNNRIQLAAVVGSVVIFAGCQAVSAVQFDGTTHRYYIAAAQRWPHLAGFPISSPDNATWL